MKKIIQLFLVLLAFLLPGFSPLPQQTVKPVRAAEPLPVVLHLYRFDGLYSNWGVWIWPSGKEGGFLPFTTTETIGDKAWISMEVDVNSVITNALHDWNKEKNVTSIDFPLRSSEQIGFIVRTSSGTKDEYNDDRFISLNKVGSDGKVHVFIVQGNRDFAYSVDEIDINPISNASFTNKTTISLRSYVNLPIEKSAYQLSNTIGEVAISKVTVSNNKSATITLTSEAIITSTYLLKVTDVGQKTVDTSTFFSSNEFDQLYSYSGELGAIYKKSETTFRVWAPTADKVELNIFDAGSGGTATNTYTMVSGEKGTHAFTLSGDLHGKYYTYNVYLKTGVTNLNVVDPYAYSTGINGNRGMIVDFERTNPTGWEKVKLPTPENPNDAIIYELHVRDLTSHITWNGTTANRGKFLGLIESGTSLNGVPTGFDHIKSLGVTHVQLLPIYDFNSVDESLLSSSTYQNLNSGGIFNWGYDPKNYNSLEGSYSSDPNNGLARIQEFKQVVKAYADAGIGIIMDVVYNHMPSASGSNFNKIVPNYYFRTQSYSGAGSDTASERFMFRKFMIDSTAHWAREYKLSGFRFDLMGLHDITTMNELATSVKTINPSAIILGEGWNMFNGSTGSSLTPTAMATQLNMDKMPQIGAFNDGIRDGIRGNISDDQPEKGFIAGATNYKDSVKLGIVGAVNHPQVVFANIKGATNKYPWSDDPSQSINYAEAHDNATLFDKNQYNFPGQTRDVYAAMQKQAYSIILTSQGTPFMQAGVEMMRNKKLPAGFIFPYDITTINSSYKYSHNSYNLSDKVNGINWQWAVDNKDVVDHYRQLIAMRKAHPVFSLPNGDDIREKVEFLSTANSLIAYSLDGSQINDPWGTVVVAHNALSTSQQVTLPTTGDWEFAFASVSDGGTSMKLTGVNTVTVPGRSSIIVYLKNPNYVAPKPANGCAGSAARGTNTGLGYMALLFLVGFLFKKSFLK